MKIKRSVWIFAGSCVALVVAVAAWWVLTPILHRQAVSQATTKARPKATPGLVPGAIGVRHYKIEAVSFHADDESGPDWWGSDEIYAEWRDPTSGFLAITRTHDDVDTGDTVRFDALESCILRMNVTSSPEEGGAWKCTDAGVPGPLEFQVALFEADTVPPGAQFCPFPGAIGPVCGADDLVDQKTVSFSTAELEAAMPHVGDAYEETIALHNFCGVPESQAGNDVYGCMATGPDYLFTYHLTRLADTKLPIHQ